MEHRPCREQRCGGESTLSTALQQLTCRQGCCSAQAPQWGHTASGSTGSTSTPQESTAGQRQRQRFATCCALPPWPGLSRIANSLDPQNMLFIDNPAPHARCSSVDLARCAIACLCRPLARVGKRLSAVLGACGNWHPAQWTSFWAAQTTFWRHAGASRRYLGSQVCASARSRHPRVCRLPAPSPRCWCWLRLRHFHRHTARGPR